MASPDQTHSVEEALEQDTVPSEAMAPEEAAAVKDLDCSGGSSSAPEEEGPEKTLVHADELFEKGSKAIEDGDFVEAVDCLSRALEIKLGLRSATFRSFSSFSCTLRWLSSIYASICIVNFVCGTNTLTYLYMSYILIFLEKSYLLIFWQPFFPRKVDILKFVSSKFTMTHDDSM